MLILPDSKDTINIIGIDPGTTFLGVAILTIDISSMLITNSEAFTLDANQINNGTWLANVYGDRFSRINSFEIELAKIFNYYAPLHICAESPFFGLRHPAAFQALTEVICAIRNTVYNYNNWKPLQLVPPSNVKQAVGGKGNSRKEIIKECVFNLLDVLKIEKAIFDNLDEHSIDALAVGYYSYTLLKNGYLN